MGKSTDTAHMALDIRLNERNSLMELALLEYGGCSGNQMVANHAMDCSKWLFPR
ncbi:hypothetical protein AB4238_06525 [Shewanella sp. 10N.286.45.A1]|uniref:hypothetical protein n=1 Tax=Shewanella sp. 10N.286.45.A1 TaxID=3229694 RepID=UPI00354B73B0